MQSSEKYTAQSVEAAKAAIRIGYGDIENLRERLIWTTSTSTCQMVEEYFVKQHSNADLLSSLIDITLEGENSGDAP